jgi:hypothetical protein
MKTKTFPLSAIAGLAIAGVVSFGAQAQTVQAQTEQTQTDVAAPATDQAPVLTPAANTTGGQTPATAPSVDWTKQRHHAGVYHGQSGPQHSTPSEKAATDLLNQQQLAQSPATPVSP